MSASVQTSIQMPTFGALHVMQRAEFSRLENAYNGCSRALLVTKSCNAHHALVACKSIEALHDACQQSLLPYDRFHEAMLLLSMHLKDV